MRFYGKLAMRNLKKNARMYIPYILACIFTISMTYMINAVAYNDDIKKFSITTSLVMSQVGVPAIMVFSTIFLFYAYSFLIKNRKKEFGLYCILGMGKKQISKIIFVESFVLFFVNTVLGLSIGIFFSKLLFMIFGNMLDASAVLPFVIPEKAIIFTLISIAITFVLNYINSIRHVYFSKPIELLKGGNMGEKMPKSKWIRGILGLAALAIGYFISLTEDIKNADAMSKFLIAILLVILGTFLVFTASSIIVLKFLKNNKKYYYKTKHFTTISSLIYRIKQNAVGLATICILSTMIIFGISVTTSVYVCIDKGAQEQEVNDLKFTEYVTEEKINNVINNVQNIYEEKGIYPTKEIIYNYINLFLEKNNNGYEIKPIRDIRMNAGISDVGNNINIFTIEDYNKANGTDIHLENDNDICVGNWSSDIVNDDKFVINEKVYNVKSIIDEKSFSNENKKAVPYCIMVKDFSVLEEFDKMLTEVMLYDKSNIRVYYGADFDCGYKEKYQFIETVSEQVLKDAQTPWGGRVIYKHATMEIIGGIVFIGLYFSALLIVAIILIIYYKQISEGYDDKKRFEIMQKVGMSQKEIKASIRSQVMKVFFMPLLLAGVHVMFAIPFVKKVFEVLPYENSLSVYYTTSAVCYLLFSFIYFAIYKISSRSYYNIVRRK